MMDRVGGEFCDRDAPITACPETNDLAETPRAGANERRMQVRAYNFWASLLGDRAFPDAADLDPASLPDFGPHGVLLDFSDGVENPAIVWLGAALADECGAARTIQRLNDVPSRSLLSRITDHYMQILANQAPVGFEAEFVNRHGATILYRGILLPFSRDQVAIDCIYGVINWKEQGASSGTAQSLSQDDCAPLDRPLLPRESAPLTEWADGPADGLPATAEALRGLPPRSPDELGRSGEFTVILARRNAAGELVLLGEVADDEALLDRTARRLLA